jgi:peptide/nickel transport system permease protein
MLTYTLRRLLLAIPTLIFISLVIFSLLDFAPGDPLANMPLTIPPEVRTAMKESLGLDEPVTCRYAKWLQQFIVTEPIYAIDESLGTNFKRTIRHVATVSPGDTITSGKALFSMDSPGCYARHDLGEYRVVIGADGDVNAFTLFDAAGQSLGTGEVGEPFEGPISFTIGDKDEPASTAFDPGDSFSVKVEAQEATKQRLLSFQSRSPVMDTIMERLPQTMKVVGIAYLVAVIIALPIGIISAYRQYSWFDQLGTFVSMIGFSVPTFFTGVLLIVIFSVWLGWFPSIYDTTLQVTDWDSFWKQVRQMVMPVAVLALFNASQISRFMRAAMLDNLNQDYVRTARAKGLTEKVVVLVHVLRNSMIPVVTVIALGIPTIFGGAIITEQVFKVNGLGQLLILAIQGNDIPMVQTLTFIFAVLIVLFNLVADVLYGILDPRIRYD